MFIFTVYVFLVVLFGLLIKRITKYKIVFRWGALTKYLSKIKHIWLFWHSIYQ